MGSVLPEVETEDIKSFCLQKSDHFKGKISWTQDLQILLWDDSSGMGTRCVQYHRTVLTIAFLTRSQQLTIKNQLPIPAKKGFSEGERSTNKDRPLLCLVVASLCLTIYWCKNVHSAFNGISLWGGLEQNKRNILVNNLFNIFCNEKDIGFYYLLQTWYWSYCKNPDFFKVGSFEILYFMLYSCLLL